MFIKSSLLAVTFVFLSMGNAIAAEVPTANNLNSETPSELVAGDRSLFTPAADLPKNLTIGYAAPLSEVLQPSTNIAQTDETTPPPTPSETPEVPAVPAVPAVAEAPNPNSTPAQPKKWAIGVHAQAATTGFLGFDAGYKFSPNLHARLGLNTGGFKYNISNSDIDYNASFQPTNIHLLGDYFPFGGGLRFTGGLVIQNNRFTATAKSNSNDKININGTNYPASSVGTLEGQGSFSNSIAPYLGIGIGTPISGGLGFNIDAGVMFSGSPKISLSAPTAPQAIQNELKIQEQKTNEDIKSFNIYPVISIGFSYAF
jgi:hypothetical protein